MSRILLTTMAAVEIATGLALLATPSFVATLLLGAPLDTAAALVLGRVAGAALVALGAFCWLAWAGGTARSARDACLAMLIYNAAGAAVLAFGGVRLGLESLLLWPAIFLHAALAGWCVITIWPRVGPTNRP